MWDIITNRRLLEINAAWAGEAGQLVMTRYNTSKPAALIATPCRSDATTQRWELNAAGSGAIRSADPNDGRCVEVPDCQPLDHNFGVANAFLAPVSDQNDQFTKTRSGQTQEKLREKAISVAVMVGPCHAADTGANCSSRNQQWDLNTTTGYIRSRMAAPPGGGASYSVLNVYDMTGPGVQMFYPQPVGGRNAY